MRTAKHPFLVAATCLLVLTLVLSALPAEAQSSASASLSWEQTPDSSTEVPLGEERSVDLTAAYRLEETTCTPGERTSVRVAPVDGARNLRISVEPAVWTIPIEGPHGTNETGTASRWTHEYRFEIQAGQEAQLGSRELVLRLEAPELAPPSCQPPVPAADANANLPLTITQPPAPQGSLEPGAGSNEGQDDEASVPWPSALVPAAALLAALGAGRRDRSS